ncbi:glycosyltransferase family 9 protein [Mucilaginibacter sp. 14171R-50]|uniref:glycosyltransferase family 9 protein n=1 Tax=Mucilaginibacter sp. 14171R-50 TaxID=2703789 RepID=UPI00138B8751|nr:glycosyltransferase family 9 protein [Mucilaginibacter sp. 14171R-50]QHS57521.1 glycosyltransferase family 9 protein [Mucilaginibacter sp. 14171R-50]
MNWQGCKNILCIRPDNMGDLIMTGAAIRALKESFGAKITVLTSSMAKGIIKHMPEIDDAIIFDLPWVKTAAAPGPESFNKVVAAIKQYNFDAAVIFTVYSQNPVPTAMLAYLAGVPQILSYCRENPYQLINNWVPDIEPYHEIKHQVRRDLDLVATVGAYPQHEALNLNADEALWPAIPGKLKKIGADLEKPFLLLHAGVSELKREYPVEGWAAAGQLLIEQGYQLILTGSEAERQLTDELEARIGAGSFSAAGMFTLSEFICLVKRSPLLISVNTGTVHIAAAVGTPVVVLYAQTNPQHTPWSVPHKVLQFPVPEQLRSKNQVIAWVNTMLYNKSVKHPAPNDIVEAVTQLLNSPVSQTQPFPGIPNENRVFEAS